MKISLEIDASKMKAGLSSKLNCIKDKVNNLHDKAKDKAKEIASNSAQKKAEKELQKEVIKEMTNQFIQLMAKKPEEIKETETA